VILVAWEFRARAGREAEFEELDLRGEALTDDERCLGWFAVVESAS